MFNNNTHTIVTFTHSFSITNGYVPIGIEHDKEKPTISLPNVFSILI